MYYFIEIYHCLNFDAAAVLEKKLHPLFFICPGSILMLIQLSNSQIMTVQHMY